jgi:hypothetical protein
MNGESNERIWNLLLAVREWLIKDLINKINYAAKITDDDFQPFFDARQALMEEQFHLDGEVFRIGRKALEESLYQNLTQFFETINRQIQARDAGDQALRESLLKQMGVQYKSLVKDFEQQLHSIRAVLEKNRREGSRIHLPSLRHVGGGIMIDSPHAEQDNRVMNVREELNVDTGSKYNISGGQIGAVGDHASASNNVFNQWNQSGGDLEKLAKDLATLRAELGKQAAQPEQFEAAAAIARAETAAKEGDGPAVFEHLKKTGQWALGIATSIGVPVAVEALKKAIGG